MEVMMSNREHILIDVETLAYLDKTNLVLLDATVILEKPQFDGDYQVMLINISAL